MQYLLTIYLFKICNNKKKFESLIKVNFCKFDLPTPKLKDDFDICLSFLTFSRGITINHTFFFNFNFKQNFKDGADVKVFDYPDILILVIVFVSYTTFTFILYNIFIRQTN